MDVGLCESGGCRELTGPGHCVGWNMGGEVTTLFCALASLSQFHSHLVSSVPVI